MNDKSKQIQKILDHKWSYLSKHTSLIHEYLDDGEIIDGYTQADLLKIMVESLSTIFGELNHTEGTLSKYEPKDYSEEDFVDMMLEAIVKEFPSKEDKDGTIKYIEEARSELWGYVNYHANKYLNSYIDYTKGQNSDACFAILRECITIVMVECSLRTMEGKWK